MAAPSVLQSHASTLCSDKRKLLLPPASQLLRGYDNPGGQPKHALCDKESGKSHLLKQRRWEKQGSIDFCS